MSTPEQLLRKLDERFILGEIGQEQYQQMRTRLQAQIEEASAVRIDTDAANDDAAAPAGSVPAHAGGMDIADSVIKGNVTSGSASVGNININVGQGTAGGSSAELEYEKCVLMTLRSGGSLESIRRELDDRRMAIGLPIRLAREIEEACLDSCGRKPIRGHVPAAVGPAGPDPLTRFFKSASESIASMFSSARQPVAPTNRPTPVPPMYPPALHANSKGGPPPVPWVAPAAAGITAPAAAAAADTASVKEALKEELRDGLRAELAEAAEKGTPHEGPDTPAKSDEHSAPVLRKPPPLPAMPPPLQWPGRGKPGK